MREFCAEKSITSGWTKVQHVGLQKRLIFTTLGVEKEKLTPAQKATKDTPIVLEGKQELAFTLSDFREIESILALTANMSQLRQYGENANPPFLVRQTKAEELANSTAVADF
jgi:hypothetical protein